MSHLAQAIVLGRNIELRACQLQLPHRDLATKLSVTPEALNRLRRGRNRFLDLELLQALCLTLNCTPDTLLLPQPNVVYDLPES
jgi:DNA-binding Xre family transcriptional regulator